MNWGMVAAREHAKRIKREVDQLLGSRSYNLFLQLMNPQFALNMFGLGLIPGIGGAADLRGIELAGSVVQGIILRPGDCLFDAGKVIAKQFLGVRAGDVRSSAIDRRHGNLCGHEGAGGSSGVFRDGHRSSSYRTHGAERLCVSETGSPSFLFPKQANRPRAVNLAVPVRSQLCIVTFDHLSVKERMKADLRESVRQEASAETENLLFRRKPCRILDTTS